MSFYGYLFCPVLLILEVLLLETKSWILCSDSVVKILSVCKFNIVNYTGDLSQVMNYGKSSAHASAKRMSMF